MATGVEVEGSDGLVGRVRWVTEGAVTGEPVGVGMPAWGVGVAAPPDWSDVVTAAAATTRVAMPVAALPNLLRENRMALPVVRRRAAEGDALATEIRARPAC